MGLISSDGDGSTSTCKFGLTLDTEVGAAELGDSTVSCSDKEIVVAEELHDIDSLLEKSVAWTYLLEKATLKIDLNDISCEGSEIGTSVVWGNNDTLVDSLDLTHGQVLEENSLLDEIAVPNADSIIVDGDKVVACVVKELDLVGDVHADCMSANSFACLSLN